MHKTLPFRQIHLDFHTSEKISGIGKDFNKKQFQEMLKLGHVNSITVFAKCHHGWSYYPAKAGRRHPNLKFDLLKAQLDACHEIGVNAPVYISAGLDEQSAISHHNWLFRHPNNTTTWVGTMVEAGYHELCLNTPYLDFLIKHTEEIVRNYDCDGIFLDIVGIRNCVCQYCIKAMLDREEDPRDPEAVARLGRKTFFNYTTRINKAINNIKPGLRIFHNNGHMTRGDHELAKVNTHLEIESLPTAHWGYDHFPLSARYCQGLGMDMLSMTGKFHTNWGEFGGYKNSRALEYETSLAIANGARCSIGDQLHPYGKMDEATYKIIGSAYSKIEKKEPWCSNVTAVADIGVISYESLLLQANSGGLIDTGAVRIMQEGKFLYDIIDLDSEFSRYRMIILPDEITVNPGLSKKLDSYLNKGGKILATGNSGLDPDKKKFSINLGIVFKGMTESNPSFLLPDFRLSDFPPAPFVMYAPAHAVKALSGAKVMAHRQNSFFNRDFLHFCSHQHAPSTLKNAGPAIVRKNQSIYISYPVFSLYAQKGQQVLRDILIRCIEELLEYRTIKTNLPPQGINTLMHQESKNRYIAHLLYAVPIKRGERIQVIDDIVPLFNIDLDVRLQKKIKTAKLVPQNQHLEIRRKGEFISVTVPEINCHQMVEFSC